MLKTLRSPLKLRTFAKIIYLCRRGAAASIDVSKNNKDFQKQFDERNYKDRLTA